MENKENEIVLDNKCPTCGANLKFNPTLGSWKCDFCKVNYTLEELKKHNNASNEKNNEETCEEKNDTNENLVIYKCGNCGAEIVTDETVAATFCIYCRNTAILKSKLSGKFAPDKIIPFKIEKEKAIEAFKNISKGRPFVPKDFNDESNIEKIRGVYVPFWLFNTTTDATITYDAKKIRTWVVGNTHYTETSTFELIRDGSVNFEKIPVDGSTRFEDDIMNSIEPFDYKDLVPYNHAYLSGFLAEKYDVESETAYKDAEVRANNSTKETFQSTTVGYSSVFPKIQKLDTKLVSKEYCLLPVWMVNVKYNNQMHIFAMNGQTGEFIGNIPLDKKKVVLYFVIIFIISFLIIIGLSYLIYKVGGAR